MQVKKTLKNIKKLQILEVLQNQPPLFIILAMQKLLN